jgi:hypothetical protein
MDYIQKIITAFELHSVSDIQECLDNGVNPNEFVHGEPLIFSLINMYTRGSAFKKCIKVLLDNGLVMEDKALLAVLLDDANLLETELRSNPTILAKKYTFQCAFTPLLEASLLHICAEYNHLACAEVLIKYGMDVNIKAGLDENGFGGQTPIFHTVNQDANKCLPMLKYLISQKADLNLTLKGLIWGKTYDWETFIPAVNPISYAMMGLLRQFQRTEAQIYEVIALLLEANDGINYYPNNIPNKYLLG